MSAGIGHNGGPELTGQSWRTHCWRRARRDLLPHMPLNVVRRRVRRAAELGLTYTTYATLRATTGRDIIGFLFSSNALGLVAPGRGLDPAMADKVAALVRVDQTGLLPDGWHAPEAPFDWATAPRPFAPWPETRAAMSEARAGRPGDGLVLIGAAPWERDWCAAGRLAGYLEAHRFVAAS